MQRAAEHNGKPCAQQRVGVTETIGGLLERLLYRGSGSRADREIQRPKASQKVVLTGDGVQICTRGLGAL